MKTKLLAIAVAAFGLSAVAVPQAVFAQEDSTGETAQAQDTEEGALSLPLDRNGAREAVRRYFERRGEDKVRIRKLSFRNGKYYARVVDTYNKPMGIYMIDKETGEISRQANR